LVVIVHIGDAYYRSDITPFPLLILGPNDQNKDHSLLHSILQATEVSSQFAFAMVACGLIDPLVPDPLPNGAVSYK